MFPKLSLGILCVAPAQWSERFYHWRDGLEVVVTPGPMGAYVCECQEGGAASVVAAYSLVWGSQQGSSSRDHTMGLDWLASFWGFLQHP